MSIEGRQIGPYRVGRRLGVGGMAEVYAAWRYGPAGFRRAVALKVLRPHLRLLPGVVERLGREALLASALRHPNLVPVLDFGVEGELAYLAMELVDGPDLRRALAAGAQAGRPLPGALAVHIAIQVCRGLAHAHGQRAPDGRPLGLIHRDVSPQNILLSRAGEVRLTDFGIATATLAVDESTRGALRGKFAYLAPEQVEGAAVDQRADLFALGVVLWEVLAGRRLFLAATDAETLARVRACRVPLPPDPPVAEVPPALWPALGRALAKDPLDRYRDAEELAEALAAACPEADRGEAVRRLAEWVRAVADAAGVPSGDGGR
ncbi:MAG TPA: serine/threonine-protein kinase, partial [Thermodesulfobacteriota bacterium]|nr:serine/threonine-protein kinase [Thermodesulfobacteriota bacterium]